MKKDRFDELALIWFKKAEDDVLWAEDSFKTGHFGAVCFICQQTAEKALKAFLFFKKEKLVRTHNLERLLKFSQRHNADFKKLFVACKVLNRYYTDTRYPDIWDYSRFEDKDLAKEALRLAEKVVKFVEEKLSF